MTDSGNNKRADEYVIDLGTLFFRMLSHWRSILLWAVIIGAAFAAFRVLTGGTTEEERAQETEAIQRIYQKASDQLAAQNTQEAQLNSLRDYQQNSLIMRIDPREKHVRETIFAIRLDRDGMLNSLDVLAAAYVYGLNLAPVAEELGVDYRYVSELVSWSIVNPGDATSITDSSEGIQFAGFRIVVIGESDEMTDRITDILQQEIEGMEKELSSTVAKHTITPIGERAYASIDDNLQQRQTDRRQQVLTLQKSVDDLETGFQEYVNTLTRDLNFSEADVKSFSFLTAPEQLNVLAERLAARADAEYKISLGGIIKNFILGCILGGILMACGWAIVCVFGKHFETANEFFTRYGVTCLGVFEPDERELGRRKTKLDRGILTHTGDYTGLDEKKTVELAAATIGNTLGERKRLLLTGTASREKILALGGELAALLPDRDVVAVPDFLCDVQTIKDMPGVDAVVLAEERCASSFDTVDRELDFLDRLRKDLLGAFVV